MSSGARRPGFPAEWESLEDSTRRLLQEYRRWGFDAGPKEMLGAAGRIEALPHDARQLGCVEAVPYPAAQALGDQQITLGIDPRQQPARGRLQGVPLDGKARSPTGVRHRAPP